MFGRSFRRSKSKGMSQSTMEGRGAQRMLWESNEANSQSHVVQAFSQQNLQPENLLRNPFANQVTKEQILVRIL